MDESHDIASDHLELPGRAGEAYSPRRRVLPHAAPLQRLGPERVESVPEAAAEVRAILDEPLEDDEAEDPDSSADIAVAND